ncbi:hypothetical protein [Lysobacter sp. 1R34A]|uniref:hypothetical protein n=1 Tax=Lysobacter sp. 1R34A TaxID=3445786 RepID=UPI003EEE010F
MSLQFHFEDIGPHHDVDEGRIGHRFRLRIVFDRREGARLHWIERCDRPYDEDMPADTWVDMFRIAGGRSSLFTQWLSTATDEGRIELDFDFDDRFSMRLAPNARRCLEWWVIAIDGEDRAGQRAWAVWQGVQRLHCDDQGRVVQHRLVQIDSLCGGEGYPPYPDGFRLST